MVAFPCACVALVPALVLNFNPLEKQWGVALRDVGVKQRRPAAEVLVLKSELIFVVVVAVNRDLLLVPVDYHCARGSKAAWQNTVFLDDASDVQVWEQNWKHAITMEIQEHSFGID